MDAVTVLTRPTMAQEYVAMQSELSRLTDEVVQERRRAEYNERAMQNERRNRRDLIIRQLVKEAKGADLPTDLDLAPMWARLVDLVECDDHDCWTPEQEYAITATYTVKVTCYATAKTEAEARTKFDDADISFNLSNYLRHELDHLDIEDTEREDLDIQPN